DSRWRSRPRVPPPVARRRLPAHVVRWPALSKPLPCRNRPAPRTAIRRPRGRGFGSDSSYTLDAARMSFVPSCLQAIFRMRRPPWRPPPRPAWRTLPGYSGLLRPLRSSRRGETVWNDSGESPDFGAGGGGFSTIFAKPSYQDGANTGSAFRGVPDVPSRHVPKH